MNPCASPESGKPPRSQAAQTTPPASPEKPTSSPASPQRAQEASSGAKPVASASFSRKASAVARPAAPSALPSAVDRLGRRRASPGSGRAGCRRRGSPPRRRRGAAPRRRRAPRPRARPLGAQVRVRGDRVRRGDRREIAAALVEDEVEPKERLQPAAEARARPAHALGDRPDPPSRGAVEVQDPIGLAVADAAQDDRLGLELARHGRQRLPDRPDANAADSVA